ncbi:hypothetical protein BVY04_04325 [bacterium M21]|nr:hypothetical protein BVY04_04325 [bacterium M21]
MSKKVSQLQRTFSRQVGVGRSRRQQRDELVAKQNRDSRTNYTEDLECMFREAELLDEFWLEANEPKEPSLLQLIANRALSSLGTLVRKRQ